MVLFIRDGRVVEMDLLRLDILYMDLNEIKFVVKHTQVNR